jgi:hypothetical protein
MMLKIILVVPPYIEHSNGIKSLHKIAHTINMVGGDARLIFLYGGIVCGGKEWTNPLWNTPRLCEGDKHLTQTEIVVYPEIISGNPLCASKVVRYLGNKDGLLTGKKMNAKPRDFLLAHSKVIEPNAHCVLFNAGFNPIFSRRDILPSSERNLDATYIGKGYLYGECSVRRDTILIERQWPSGQEQLAYLLRLTRYFYTWDSWTATNVEAALCGAIPIFLRYEPWTEAEIDGSEIGEIPRLDAQNPEFDALKFQEGRRKLIENINWLDATWDNRVKAFVGQVTAHFAVA